jgi:hypothetical protein
LKLGKSFSNEPRSRTSRAGAIRTIGITRARIKIGMANLAFNFQRLAWLEGQGASA